VNVGHIRVRTAAPSNHHAMHGAARIRLALLLQQQQRHDIKRLPLQVLPESQQQLHWRLRVGHQGSA
jgi:hypothetical protein